MSRSVWLVVASVAILGAWGCTGRTETPPDVKREYDSLIGTLDPGVPGASLVRLQEFRRRNAGYAIASAVDAEIAAWQDRSEAAYLNARDLVREEQFDKAEAILTDLAGLQDARAGRLAREFLAFEFHYVKASRLLQRGDTAAAEAVARRLRQLPLTEEQRSLTERLLDSVGTVDLGVTMTRAAALKSAARMLQTFLHAAYAEEGQYPKDLTLDSPALASLRNAGSFDGVVGSIEDYRATQDEFSLVITGKDPRQRYRVTQSTIEEVRSPEVR